MGTVNPRQRFQIQHVLLEAFPFFVRAHSLEQEQREGKVATAHYKFYSTGLPIPLGFQFDASSWARGAPI